MSYKKSSKKYLDSIDIEERLNEAQYPSQRKRWKSHIPSDASMRSESGKKSQFQPYKPRASPKPLREGIESSKKPGSENVEIPKKQAKKNPFSENTDESEHSSDNDLAEYDDDDDDAVENDEDLYSDGYTSSSGEEGTFGPDSDEERRIHTKSDVLHSILSQLPPEMDFDVSNS